MEKTWKPIAAGILDIVSGALRVLGAIGVIVGIVFFMPLYTNISPGLFPEFGRWLIPGVLETILVIATAQLTIDEHSDDEAAEAEDSHWHKSDEDAVDPKVE